jgi:hypothetical protein
VKEIAPVAKKKKMKVRIIGKIHHAKIHKLQIHKAVLPIPECEVTAFDPLPKEDHIIVAVPKSSWQKFMDWLQGSY